MNSMDSPDTLFTELRRGDEAEVLGFGTMDDHYRNRLLSMGLTPGTRFRVERRAPLGDPVEISLRGFRLSLRRAEAAALRVQRL
jgi:ferrous iron transport protein A